MSLNSLWSPLDKITSSWKCYEEANQKLDDQLTRKVANMQRRLGFKASCCVCLPISLYFFDNSNDRGDEVITQSASEYKTTIESRRRSKKQNGTNN